VIDSRAVKRRLPLLLLASLLLFGQLASAALQLCLEEDGSVNVEITLLDCGMVEMHGGHQAHSQKPCHEEEKPAPCGTDGGVSEYVDLCLDFDFNLNQRQAQSISDCLASTLQQHWVPLAAGFYSSTPCASLAWSYEDDDWRGPPTHRWLEREDLLAILHTAQPVVMRC
jgi:hypothetical protein